MGSGGCGECARIRSSQSCPARHPAFCPSSQPLLPCPPAAPDFLLPLKKERRRRPSCGSAWPPPPPTPCSAASSAAASPSTPPPSALEPPRPGICCRICLNRSAAALSRRLGLPAQGGRRSGARIGDSAAQLQACGRMWQQAQAAAARQLGRLTRAVCAKVVWLGQAQGHDPEVERFEPLQQRQLVAAARQAAPAGVAHPAQGRQPDGHQVKRVRSLCIRLHSHLQHLRVWSSNGCGCGLG